MRVYPFLKERKRRNSKVQAFIRGANKRKVVSARTAREEAIQKQGARNRSGLTKIIRLSEEILQVYDFGVPIWPISRL